MKKLCLTLLCLHLLWGVGFATDSFVVGFGTASSKTTVPKLPGVLQELSPSLAHEATGTSWNVGYQTTDGALLRGFGYQSFETSGIKSTTTRLLNTPIQSTMETEKFNFSGIYGALGLNLAITENLFFQPNLQLGFGKYEISFLWTVRSPRGSAMTDYSESFNSLMTGFVLPLVYQGKNFNIGGQIVFPRSSVSYEETVNTSTEKYNFEFATAYQLVVGYNFSP